MPQAVREAGTFPPVVVGFALLVLLAAMPPPRTAGAAASDRFVCSRSAGSPTAVFRKADLPEGVLPALEFEMADPGEPFQVTDVVVAPSLPTRRLICAYSAGDARTGGFVVEWEYGGIRHGRGATELRRTEAGSYQR